MLDIIKNFINSKDKNKAQKLYEEALQLEQKGLKSEAMSLMWEALKKNPTYSEAYNHIAWSYALANMYLTESEKLAYSAINSASNHSSRSAAQNTLGEIYFRQNKISQAILAFQDSLASYSRFDSLYRLSFCYQLTQNTLEAYQVLIQAKQLQKDYYYIDLYQRLGSLCVTLGYHNSNYYYEAIEYFRFALDLSNNSLCYGLTDWGTFYVIPPGGILNLRKCELLIGFGLAYFHLNDFMSSKNCWEDANRIFPQHPYSLYNLACIASRFDNQNELYCLLEKLMPLIEDQSFVFDPPNITNKTLKIDSSTIINQLLKEPDLRKHYHIIIEVLWKHRKISELFYLNNKKLSENKFDTEQNTGISINIYNSTVGGFSVGENSEISSDISLQKSSDITLDSVKKLSGEVDNIIGNLIKEKSCKNFDPSLEKKEEKIVTSNNSETKQLGLITDVNSNVNKNRKAKKLKRST